MSGSVSIDLESGSASSIAASFPLSLLTSIKATELSKVRILIVGDSGTGKSVLTSRLAGVSVKELKENPYSSLNLGNTSGCQTECKLFEFKNHHALQQQQQQQQQYSQYAHSGSTMQHRLHSSYSSPSSASYSTSSSTGGSGNSSSLYFVELWDVSGHRKFIPSRDVFYTGINGVIFVFDLMNRKSYENIRKWIKELVKVDRERGIEDKSGTTDTDLISPGGNLSASGIHRPPSRSNSNNPSPHHSPAFRPSPSPLHATGTGSTAAVAAALHAASPVNLSLPPSSSPSIDSGASALGSMPVLIVGNKLDEYRTNSAEQGSYESIKDFGIDSVYVSALDSSSEQWVPVEKFFDRVIVHRYFRQLELHLQASALQSSTSRFHTTTPFAQTNVNGSVGNTSYNAMSYAMSDLNQVGSGMSNRRMVAPTAASTAPIFPNSGKPPIPSYPSQYERRMSGGGVELQSPAVGYSSSTSPMQANNASSLSSASARREFTPPPIRTFADFTLSSPSTSSTYSTIGGIEEESSPNSGASPNVLAPSSAMDDWHARSNYATSYRTTTTAATTPSYLAGTGASSLPTNTALHALTQQPRYSNQLHSN